MAQKIHIVSINIFKKDAIGNFCYDLATVYKQAGYDVALYASGSDPDGSVKPIEALKNSVSPLDIIFYHHSIFEPNLEIVLNLKAKKIVYFHGITPPELLAQYAPQTAKDCESGLEQIKKLRDFDVYLANSKASISQFKNHANYDVTNMMVLPPVLATRMKQFQMAVTTKSSEEKKLLCVGRIAPHKKVDDVINLISAYKAQFPNKHIRLIVAGGIFSPDYQTDLESYCHKMHCEDVVEFTGLLTDEQLAACYQQADAYILMSEHEGFGVPLMEAMAADLPIIAYRQNGVDAVLGDSGYQFTEKNFTVIAAALDKILHDKNKNAEILTNQKKRYAQLMESASSERYLSVIKKLSHVENGMVQTNE